MKLIIGLGNPGTKYLKNRHNAGHLFVDFWQGVTPPRRGDTFIKTDCFMNDSGKFVKANLVNWSNLTNLFVVHDDLDIPLGKYKIQFGKGPELHYGVTSVENELGTKDFWRIRIGIDSRNNQDTRTKIQGEDYVLQDFTDEELKILEGVFNAIIKDSSFPG